MILLGWIFYTKSKLEESLKWNQMLYDLNKYYPGIANNLALTEKMNKNFEKAEKLYKETETLCENNPVALHNIALFYEQIDKEEEEKEYIDKMYNLNPKSAFACTQYGSYLHKYDQKEEALKIIKDAINLDPKNIRPYEELLQISFKDDEYENGIIYAEKCLEICPNNGYYYQKLGQCYQYFQQFEKAIQAYTKAEQFPDNRISKVRLFSNWGFACYELDKYDESLELCFRSCNQNEIYKHNHEIKGVCQLINGGYPITLNKKIELINKQEGPVIMKFEKIACQIKDLSLKNLFLERLENLRTILFIYSYKRNIQSELIFQPSINLFDLFID